MYIGLGEDRRKARDKTKVIRNLINKYALLLFINAISVTCLPLKVQGSANTDRYAISTVIHHNTCNLSISIRLLLWDHDSMVILTSNTVNKNII